MVVKSLMLYPTMYPVCTFVRTFSGKKIREPKALFVDGDGVREGWSIQMEF